MFFVSFFAAKQAEKINWGRFVVNNNRGGCGRKHRRLKKLTCDYVKY